MQLLEVILGCFPCEINHGRLPVYLIWPHLILVNFTHPYTLYAELSQKIISANENDPRGIQNHNLWVCASIALPTELLGQLIILNILRHAIQSHPINKFTFLLPEDQGKSFLCHIRCHNCNYSTHCLQKESKRYQNQLRCLCLAGLSRGGSGFKAKVNLVDQISPEDSL